MTAITPARQEDVAAFLGLLRQNRLPTAGATKHLGSALVARDGDRVVGGAALELYGRAALLRSVVADGSRRGQGLGRMLVESALTLATDRGVETVYLLTETAAAFFAHLGFTRVNREDVDPAVRQSVEFCDVCPASAVCMMKSLTTARNGDAGTSS